jgi:glycosyltransferase involved in cell wall biosynthesis
MDIVSVIIPAYNKAQLTVKTVESVLAQTYPHLEIIVVDDGSTDDTRLALKFFDQRIRYVYKKNGGACSARNEGIRLATGNFMAFIDCDDLYVPEKLERSVEYLKRNSEYAFVHTAASFIDGEGNVTGRYSHPRSRREGVITNRLIMGNFICNSTVVARSEAVRKAGFFDETIFTPADWDMWLRLSIVGGVGYIDAPLTQYRIEDNYTFNKFDLARTEDEKVLTSFFNRHPESSVLIRCRAWSNFYLRFAQGYLVKGDQVQYHSTMNQAFKAWPFNFKLWVMFFWSMVSLKTLKENLTKRIVRR